jgi:hypothetical protein
MGILDTIIHTKQSDSLKTFRPSDIVAEILNVLKDRDRQILIQRYGLNGNEIKTLAAIGNEHSLTRERVRQIEKDLLKNLRKTGLNKESFITTKELLMSTINEHGRIMAQDSLLQKMGVKAEEDRNAIIFLLYLIEELEDYMHANYKKTWTTILFNKQLLNDFTEESKKILDVEGKPLSSPEFLEKFKATEFYKLNQAELTDRVILNFLDLAHEIESNVFDQWGLSSWKEITPKDVGDKAFLVMKNHGKPEHYSLITEMINKAKFDQRTAYKETVHNELIKDKRFILIGRGIYALQEWGYKPGVVSEVLAEVLKASGGPMDREKIIDEVLKKRLVKKNTILVGLSNKKLFKKVGKNLYTLV